MRGIPLGVEIGKDVGATETVDGLLGVPDEIKARPLRGGTRRRFHLKDGLEDFALDRGGVLKFVNESGLVFSAQFIDEASSTLGSQCGVEPGEKVIIGQNLLAVL